MAGIETPTSIYQPSTFTTAAAVIMMVCSVTVVIMMMPIMVSYRQICSSRPPMHPVLPQLVEVFVRSVLGLVAGAGAAGATNDPITEQEILAVFQLSSFSRERSSEVITITIILTVSTWAPQWVVDGL